MATITATTPTSVVACAALVHKGATAVSSSPVLGLLLILLNCGGIHVLGLPQMRMRGGRVRCSSEEKAASAGKSTGMGASALLAAASVISASSPALALVDERMSTEGTGLSLGLSNNLLGWIILGVFGLIWSLFIVYTSTLEEDEESGLSL